MGTPPATSSGGTGAIRGAGAARQPTQAAHHHRHVGVDDPGALGAVEAGDAGADQGHEPAEQHGRPPPGPRSASMPHSATTRSRYQRLLRVVRSRWARRSAGSIESPCSSGPSTRRRRPNPSTMASAEVRITASRPRTSARRRGHLGVEGGRLAPEQRHHQVVAVGEVLVDERAADARVGGHRLHRHRGRPARLQQGRGRVEQDVLPGAPRELCVGPHHGDSVSPVTDCHRTSSGGHT